MILGMTKISWAFLKYFYTSKKFSNFSETSIKEVKQEISRYLVLKKLGEIDETIIKIKKLFSEICDISNQIKGLVGSTCKLSQCYLKSLTLNLLLYINSRMEVPGIETDELIRASDTIQKNMNTILSFQCHLEKLEKLSKRCLLCIWKAKQNHYL